MSEQSKILAELQEIIMNILKNGTASEAEGKRIDELEAQLHQQKCYQEIDHDTYTYQGEEIAALFGNDHYTEAIKKLCASEITPEDFFGFIGYHDEDEEYSEIFTEAFMAQVGKDYIAMCHSK